VRDDNPWKPEIIAGGKAQQDDKKPGDKPAGRFTVTKTVREAARIPRRPWLGPPYLMRRQITMLHGPGGAGKSQLAIGWAVASILHHTFGRFAPVKPCRVLMGNFEDDIDEQDRRINAALEYCGAGPADLDGKLIRLSTEEDATMFVLDDNGQVATTAVWHEFETICEDEKPDLVCLDPLIVLNATPEDISTHARRVVVYLQRLAKRRNLALLLAHHDRKGAIGPDDQDAARGSGDWAAAVRFEKAVRIMTEQQAGGFGIETDRRGFYFRVGSESSKVNYAAPEAAEWFERHAVPINGEMVVRCEPWQPPSDKIDQDQADQIVDLIGRGSRFGPYSPQIGNTNRSIGPELVRLGIEAPRAQHRALKQLEAAGRIERAKFRTEHGDQRTGLRTEAGEPAGANWEDG
jgi:hypothetical protein